MRIRKPGRWILLLLVLGVGAYYGAAALRWYMPPQFEIASPETVPADELFELNLLASKPVVFEVEYGSTLVELPSAAEEWTFFLPALAGESTLSVRALDAAGNEVADAVTVTGLRQATVSGVVPATVLEGDPLTVFLGLGDPDSSVSEVLVNVDNEAAELHPVAGGLAAFSGVPLDSGAGEITVGVTVTDVFGRDRLLQYVVTVETLDIPVDVLQLSAEVLDLMTDENRAFEAALLAEAYASPIHRPVWTEPFLLPSQGVGTSGFGDPRRYFAGGPVSYHEGADIAAPAGTPVLATNRGEVLVADFWPLKGGFVVLDHGAGVTSHYAHLQEVHVLPGQVLARGELLGDMGTTGISTGPHLHWEMRVNGVTTHPLAWVDRRLPGIDLP